MKTLVIAATAAELGPLIAHFSLNPELVFQSHELFDLLITGVGMTATAFAIGRYARPEHTLLLNLGIAGTFEPALAPGTVVRVLQDTFTELGAEDGEDFLTLDALGLGASSMQPAGQQNYPLADALPGVSGITVNTVHGNSDSIHRLLARLGGGAGLIESMEGAAVFFAARQLQTDSLQVRAISNLVERRNRLAWQIGKAVASLNDWGIHFLRTQQSSK